MHEGLLGQNPIECGESVFAIFVYLFEMGHLHYIPGNYKNWAADIVGYFSSAIL